MKLDNNGRTQMHIFISAEIFTKLKIKAKLKQWPMNTLVVNILEDWVNRK